MITSVEIEDRLWERVKVLTVMERTTLKAVVNEALEMYLKQKKVTEGRKGK
jgi:hypothetical protein